MKPKIYITERIPAEVEQYLAKYCEYEIWDGESHIPRHILLQNMHDKDGLLNFGIQINEELLQSAPNLKVVSNIAVGYDNFDLRAMNARNIIGTNTPYVLDDTVADLIIGLMLATSRRICELHNYIREGHWNEKISSEYFGLDVHHATLGIIGMGRIGECVAKRAKFGFDMNVLYYNRRRKEEAEKKYEAHYCPLDELLQKSDFVVLMTPLSNETYHLIGKREFNLMKDTAVFINASRGHTVDEKALIDALQHQKIFGAGIDTFTREPVNKDNPLLQLRNAVLLPHIGSATKKTRFDMAMTAAQNLIAALNGQTPPYIVK